MNQWQDPACHATFPKLIFTTSTNRKYGFRAYVVDSEWYTKLHGAASQQYNFVTLTNPMMPARLDEDPNNLSEEGRKLLAVLRAWGHEDADLLHLVAAFYNSSYARDYISREEESMLPLPEVKDADSQMVGEIVEASKRLRDLRAAREARGQPGNEAFPASIAPKAIMRLKQAELVADIEKERLRLDDKIDHFLRAGEEVSDGRSLSAQVV
jgi:hypothetical protein